MNVQSRYFASFQSVMGTKNLYSLNKFLKAYDGLNESDKKKITNIEAVMAKKNHLSLKLFFTYTFTVVMYICIFISLLFALIFILRISPFWKYISRKLGIEPTDYLYNYIDNGDDKREYSDDKSEDFRMPYEINENFFEYNPKTDALELEYVPYEPKNDENAFFVDYTPFDPGDLCYMPDDPPQEPLPYVDNKDFFAYNTEKDNKDLAVFEDMEEQTPLPYVGNKEYFGYNTPEDRDEFIYDEPEAVYPSFLHFSEAGNKNNESEEKYDDIPEFTDDGKEVPLPYVDNDEFFEFDESKEAVEVDYFPDFYNELAFLRVKDGAKVEEVRIHGEEIADLVAEEEKEDGFKIY